MQVLLEQSEPSKRGSILTTFESRDVIPSADRGLTAIKVRRRDGDCDLTFTGRAAWALGQLICAGEEGCTPITHPGPRWSHYCWLIRGASIDVETIHELHGGPYSGHHARYVLRTPLHVLAIEEA